MQMLKPLALVLALVLPTGSLGAEPGGADAARDVIRSQLEAFQAEDVERAYAFASPSIQRQFGDPENFGAMVRGGYPMVWKPAETAFLDAEPLGDGLIQRLRIVDQAGQPYIAEYRMTLIDGEWRISGVRILKDESYGV